MKLFTSFKNFEKNAVSGPAVAQRWPTGYILPPIANSVPLASCWAVRLPFFWPSQGPITLYNGCKGSEADGPGRSNTVLRVDNQSREVQTQTHSGLFVGYEYHLGLALVKPTQERWLKLQDLIT